MSKKIIPLLLTICIIAVLIPMSVSAAEIVDSGTCGDNLTWILDSDGVLTVSGNGEMPDRNSDAPWHEKKDDITTVVIKEGVTNIGADAFYKCSNLTNIAIPESVTDIGAFAFSNCESLTSIKIPDGVTGINEGTFQNCLDLTSVEIPDSITGIGKNAFRSCRSLKGIDIPDGVTDIGYSAFSACWSLTDIVIPKGITSIVERTFEDCRKLTSVSIPDSVTSIGDFVFADCRSLTGIDIPDSVTNIGECAFLNCKSLTDIEIPDGVRIIRQMTFYNCESLTSITIPASVTDIESDAFSRCGLKEINFAGSSEMWEAIKGISELGDVKVNFREACDHVFGEEQLISAATCKESAKYKKICTKCEYVEMYTAGKASGHTETLINVKEATEREEGYTGDKVCSVCGEELEKGKVIPVLGAPVSVGDVNGDGAVNALDATQILRYANGKSSVFTSRDDILKAADVNGDGLVNALDATQILRYANGKSSVFVK